MSKKKIKPEDNHADQLNPNDGTSGKNSRRKAAEDNRSRQLNDQDNT